MRRLAALTILSLIAALTVGMTSSAARTAHPRKHHAVRCRPKDVRIEQRHHKARCVPAKKMPRLRHANKRGLFTSLLTFRRIGKRRVNTGPAAKRAAAALSAALDRAESSNRRSARMAGGRSSAHAADAGPTVDGWHTTVDPGDGQGPVTVDARKGDSHLKLSEEDRLDLAPCPDGAGKVPAKRTWLESMDGDLPLGHGLHAEVHFLLSEKGKLVGHSTDDAAFKDLDLEEHFLEHVQAALIGPHGKVLGTNPPNLLKVTSARTHVPPGTGYAQSFEGATYSNSVMTGDRLSVQDFQKMVGWLFYWTIRKAANTGDGAYVLEAKNSWQRGHCVTVSASAPRTEVTPGQSVDVTVVPQAKVPSKTPLKITVAGAPSGTVTPTQTTALPGQSVHFTYTAPGTGGFDDSFWFAASSRQGRGEGFMTFHVEAPAAGYQYDVSLTAGSGSYQEQDAAVSGSDTENWSFSDVFNFTSSWHGVVIPLAGAPSSPQVSASAGNLSGSVDTVYDASNGSATAHYECTSPLTDTNSQSEYTQNVTPGNGEAAGTPVTINGWANLLADNPDQSCTQSGFFTVAAASAGGAGQPDIATQNAYTGTVTVTPVQLAQQQFTVALDSPPLTSECTNASGTSSCSHTLSWHATVTFTKTGTCTADRFANYTCKPL